MINNILNDPFLEVTFFNNTVLDYITFAVLFIGLALSIFTAKYILRRKLFKLIKKEEKLQILLDVLNRIRLPFYLFVSFYVTVSVLELPPTVSRIIFLIFIIWASVKAVRIGTDFVDFLLDTILEKKASKGSVAMVRAMGNIAKGILWIFAGMVVLSLLGVNVTGMVAGMGIGGVAIAFALQGILSDLFSSFSLYFDKPFVEGDFVVIGDTWGTVERIGIKSTRIRSIQGEEVIFSNKELTSVKVHNMGRMKRRRAEFDMGVTYETPTKKMEKIPSIVQKIVEKEEEVTFDRIHFFNFGDFSLDYKLVYFVDSPDYMKFMDINERVLLNIKKAFEKEKIDFAYPTKTIHLSKN